MYFIGGSKNTERALCFWGLKIATRHEVQKQVILTHVPSGIQDSVQINVVGIGAKENCRGRNIYTRISEKRGTQRNWSVCTLSVPQTMLASRQHLHSSLSNYIKLLVFTFDKYLHVWYFQNYGEFVQKFGQLAGKCRTDI